LKLIFGDFLKVGYQIPEKSVDMVLADPPYEVTKCKWDSIIPLEPMWVELQRIIKLNGAIVMTASQPFTSILIMSNLKMFRYTWVYQKTTPTGYLNAKKMPMRVHEDVVVFYKKLPIYNPQKTFNHKRKISTANHKRNCKKTEVYGKHELATYDSTERYPISVQKFSTDKQKSKLHSTQKPIALMKYFIKTYTNKGETVLDFAMGSGTTGDACRELGRRFIGIDSDKLNFNIAKKRLYDPK